MFSDYCKQIKNILKVSVDQVKNHAPKLFDRERDVLHYKKL